MPGLTLEGKPASDDQFGIFGDLARNPSETSSAFAENVPYNQLIGGGTPGAPAIQIVDGKVSNVPTPLITGEPDYGPFSDLMRSGRQPLDNYEDEFGIFSDLAPKPDAPATASVVADTPTPDDLNRVQSAIQETQSDVGLLTQPLRENWQPAMQARRADENAAMTGTQQALDAVKVLTQPLRANWQPAPLTPPAQDDLGIPTGQDILARRQAQGTIPANAKGFQPLSASEAVDYVLPGVGAQLDNSLAQFYVPPEYIKGTINAVGQVTGGDALAALMPAGVQRANAGLTDAVAENISGLTTPENIKIFGALALTPGIGLLSGVHRLISLGFGTQAAVGTWQALKQAATETDPQKFWEQVGNAAAQGAMATAATAHGVSGLRAPLTIEQQRAKLGLPENNPIPKVFSNTLPTEAPTLPETQYGGQVNLYNAFGNVGRRPLSEPAAAPEQPGAVQVQPRPQSLGLPQPEPGEPSPELAKANELLRPLTAPRAAQIPSRPQSLGLPIIPAPKPVAAPAAAGEPLRLRDTPAAPALPNEPAAETSGVSAPSDGIRAALNRMDFADNHSGAPELADDLEALDNLPAPLTHALQNYRDAQAVTAQEFGFRGDLDERAGEELEKEARRHATTDDRLRPRRLHRQPLPLPPFRQWTFQTRRRRRKFTKRAERS